MKKQMIAGIFLGLIFVGPGTLRAQGEIAEAVPLPKVATYNELRHAISEARVLSRHRVAEAVEKEKIREMWEIGRLVDAHVLQHKERADYDKQVISRLASDLGMSGRELYYMLEFYRAYPNMPHASKLSWSDYRDLLSVNVPEKRKALTEQAEKEGWDRARLRAEIRNSNRSEKIGPTKILTAQPGIPYTYRVVRGTEENERVIDLGFSNYYKPAEKLSFKEGEIIQMTSPFLKEKKGDFNISRTPSLQKRGTETDRYTYEAEVLDVIDGDTIKALVALGFGFRTVQTLRLRGIDAPEIATEDGMESKKTLEKMLQVPGEPPGTWKKTPGRERGAGNGYKGVKGKAGARVLIKTVKSDKYDRYLADIWVDGRYVNQELIDQGLAVLVEG